MARSHGLIACIAGLVLVALLLARPAAGLEELNLEQVVALALKRNPSLQTADYQVESLRAQVVQARSGLLPQGSLSSSASRISQDTSTVQDEYNYTTNTVTLTQLIYDFGATPYTLEKSEKNLAAGEMDRKQTLADLIRNVKNAYYEVVKKRILLEVRKSTVKMLAKQTEQAQALFSAGLRPKAYATKAAADLSQARLRVVQAEFDLKIARATLEEVLGGPPTRGAYRLTMASQVPAPPDKINGLLTKAEGHRPAIQSFLRQIEAAEANKRSIQGEYFPSLDAVITYTFEGQDTDLDKEWDAGLTLTWDFFTGLETVGQVDQAQADLMKLKSQMKSEELSVRKEVEQAFFACQQAHKSIALSKSSLETARENLIMAKERFDRGVGNAIELSDAIQQHTQARSDVTQSKYSYLQALAELDRAVGTLPRSAIDQRPQARPE